MGGYQYPAPEFDQRRERGDGRRPPRRDHPPPPRAIFRIHYALQNLSLEELPGWIADTEQRLHLRIFIFNRQGEEIFDAEPLPGSRKILAQLTGRQRFAQLREGNNLLFAQQINRPDEGRLAAVVVNLPPKSPFIHALTQYLWLRLLLAVVFTGLISFLVSRYLTQPLKALQFAARRLAEGELNTVVVY